jgi:tRNA pseudouridine38-40 synthase
MRTLKLTLQYDGSDYVGWQRQANGVSVQQLVEEVLAEIEGHLVPVHGASRTDAGVHALGQVASLKLEHPISAHALGRALNAKLPDTVRVLDVCETAPDFHARYAARAKTYHYRLLTGAIAGPFERRWAWHVPGPLVLDSMRRAMTCLVGTHDFVAFRAAGGSTRTTVRTIVDAGIDIEPLERRPFAASPDPLLVVRLTGDGFLRHMVRMIVGTLVEVGEERRAEGALADAMASGDRGAVGPTAPAHGLVLVGVKY